MDEVRKAILTARAQQTQKIFDNIANAKEVVKNEDNVEKAHIMEALSNYGNNSLKVSKTGQEIADQARNVLIPKLNAELEKYKAQADGLLAQCGTAPTKTPDPWWSDGTEIDVGYKIYEWREMSPHQDSVAVSTLSAEDAAAKRGNVPADAAQAEAREKYNEAVRMICNVMVDLKACEILCSLNPKEKYELNTRQVLSLGFVTS